MIPKGGFADIRSPSHAHQNTVFIRFAEGHGVFQVSFLRVTTFVSTLPEGNSYAPEGNFFDHRISIKIPLHRALGVLVRMGSGRRQLFMGFFFGLKRISNVSIVTSEGN